MSSFRRQSARTSARAACLSALLLLAYVFASLGSMPSPSTVAGWFGKVSGEKYPCAQHGCGCASANECWSHCCCFSEHERLVWAIENGVLPPDSVSFTDAQWLAASNAVKLGSAHCEVCVDQIKDNLRHGVATASDHNHSGVCDAHCGTPATTRAQQDSADSKPCCGATAIKAAIVTGRSWPVPSMSALACKSVSQLLTSVPPASQPRSPVVVTLALAVPCVEHAPVEAFWYSRSLEIPEPPPRPCAAPAVLAG